MGTEPKSLMGGSYSKSAHDLYKTLQGAYAVARNNIDIQQQTAKKHYNSNLHVQEFEVGEWAFVWKPPPKKCTYRKFYDHWRGPFEIVAKFSTHSLSLIKSLI